MPDWLFLDESTSAFDEKLEAELYAVLGWQGRRSCRSAIVRRWSGFTSATLK
jgi:ABC-type uncharacterized transport system fused permease/ATPase subunit